MCFPKWSRETWNYVNYIAYVYLYVYLYHPYLYHPYLHNLYLYHLYISICLVWIEELNLILLKLEHGTQGTEPMEWADITGYETIQPTPRCMKITVENINHKSYKNHISHIKNFTHHTQRNFFQSEAHSMPIQTWFLKKLKAAGGWRHTVWWWGKKLSKNRGTYPFQGCGLWQAGTGERSVQL